MKSMNDFRVILIDPKPVTLNLRVTARKFGYCNVSGLAEKLGWESRRLRRLFSGSQEPKPSVLSEIGEAFGIESHHFLKSHCLFVDYLNCKFPTLEKSVPEIKGIFEMQENKNFKISLFGYNEDHAVLRSHKGYYHAFENIKCTEQEACVIFEKRCTLEDELTGTVLIGELSYEGSTVQFFNKERYEIMLELLKKTSEIWQRVNPELEETIEFRSPLFDRYARILPNKEYELLMTLRAEIFPHLLAKTVF